VTPWTVDAWHGLYSEGWKGEIVDEAFKHPAKYSRALIRRIYQHCAECGWLAEGDRVVDPFGGVALGAHDALRLGLHYTGVELEPRFVALGGENIALWNKRYAGHFARWGTARLLQGDSRQLAAVVSGADLCVSSPPYAGTRIDDDYNPAGQDENLYRDKHTGTYGSTPGNLVNPRPGDFAAAVSSPPYAQSLASNSNGIDASKLKTAAGPNSMALHPTMNYSSGSDNLGNASTDDFWTAARTIVAQVYGVLAPGGHAAWVVKRFVRNKQIVEFSDQWRQLCEAAGFVTVHWHRAMLVEDNGTQLAHDGHHHAHRTARKSFFRRLAESKGSPAIDWEDVICMVRP
jgi:hypothetical protein